MFGKSGSAKSADSTRSFASATMALALAALLIAIAGLFAPFGSNVTPTSCPSPTALAGLDGEDGLSAYQVWLSQGNTGDEKAFLNSLVGKQGATGYIGKNGKSAYQLWLDSGNVGTPDEFLTALIGSQGVAGLSAYELWLLEGNSGTVQEFLASLKGATGAPGADGANGTCTVGVGYYGYFWDEPSQQSTQAVNGMIMRRSGSANGVSVVNSAGTPSTDANPGSLIKFAHAGTYNIAFSAQLIKVSGNSVQTMSIWLKRNGQNVPYTNTNIELDKTLTEMVAAWNFFVDVDAGDTVELAWHTTDPTIEIQGRVPYTDGGANIPGIPSVIVTVNQVR